MHGHSVLEAAATVAAGSGVAMAAGAAAWAENPTVASSRLLPGSLIQAHDGTALFYKDWGTGKPMVFVQSWALCSDMWDYQMTPFAAQGLRCVAYDKRGHGRSGRPGQGYDFDTLADDLAAVIEALDLRDVTLVGHSMAGGEIVRYLSRHGSGRVARIALVAPTTPFLLRTADNPDGIDGRAFEALRATFARDFPQWLADNTAPFFTSETSPAMIQWVMRMGLQCSLKAAIDCNRAITDTDFRAELRALKVPALVVHGERDASAPLALTGTRTAALIPDGRLIVYEGAPHGLFVTHMARLNADLLAWARG